MAVKSHNSSENVGDALYRHVVDDTVNDVLKGWRDTELPAITDAGYRLCAIFTKSLDDAQFETFTRVSKFLATDTTGTLLDLMAGSHCCDGIEGEFEIRYQGVAVGDLLADQFFVAAESSQQ